MQCEVYIPEDNLGIQCHPCPRDVTRECADCGKKLCREHIFYCCDLYCCEFCLEVHQTSEAHISASEVLEDAA